MDTRQAEGPTPDEAALQQGERERPTDPQTTNTRGRGISGWVHRHPWVSAVVAFILGLSIGSAGADTSSDGSGPPPQARTAEEPAAEPEPEEPAVEPNPNAKYGHSCDYVLGDFTESSSGYRFLADANLKNVGNVGLQVKATAVWFLAGGGSIKQSKTVNVPLGGEKRVGFMEVASQDEIDRHQALGFSQKTCTVKAAIVDTFGEPQG